MLQSEEENNPIVYYMPETSLNANDSPICLAYQFPGYPPGWP